MPGLAGDQDFLCEYDEEDSDEEIVDVLWLNGALRAYGRAVHTNPIPPKHERTLRILTRTGTDGRLKPRVTNCYFAIDAPGSSSLCFAISGDCGRKKYILPPTFTYWVAPGDGLIFLYQPSSDHIAWLQDGYEFKGPERVSHAPCKAKLGLRTVGG